MTGHTNPAVPVDSMSTRPVRPVEGRTTTTPEAPDPVRLGGGSGRVTAASQVRIVSLTVTTSIDLGIVVEGTKAGH